MSKEYDVIILGGGPAGLTAGIYLARAKQRALIVDEGTVGGQVIFSHLIANYPGYEEISGYLLANNMKMQAKSFGCDIVSNSEITKMDLTGEVKTIEVDDDDVFTAKAVILAVGGVPRSLGIDSEARLKGAGISYCATCDGDFFTGKDIVVIGGGNSAVEEAVSLTQFASSVTIVHQFDKFQAYQHAIDEAKENPKIKCIMESEVVDFIGDSNLEKVQIKNRVTGDISEIEASGAFIFIGYVPNTKNFDGLVNLSANGEIIADESMATSLSGVFAAGDVRQKKIRQITTAVSDGTIAALSAIEYIKS